MHGKVSRMAMRVALTGALLVAAGTAGCSLEEDKGIEAQVMCEEFVKDKLKAPSTADFSDQEHEELGDGWKVTGVVDAENGFGAKIRAGYVCELENTGGDEWTASRVQLLE